MTGITLAYGRCSCIMHDEKYYITKALEESIENIKKIIKTTKGRTKIDRLEQEKANMQTMLARVGHTPECK